MISLTNLKRLWRIAGFKKNWNGYDADPIPKLVILRTFLVLVGSPSEVEIFPTAAETIQIEDWPYDFELEIGKHVAFLDKGEISRSIDGTFNIRRLQAELRIAIEDSIYEK